MQRAWMGLVLALALAGVACDDLLPPQPSAPTRAPYLKIVGPGELEVGQSAAYSAQWVDLATGATSAAALESWSAVPQGLMEIASFGGTFTARRAGTVTLRVLVGEGAATLQVLIKPKFSGLAVEGLPVFMAVGDEARVEALAVVDRGDGDETVSFSQLAALLPGLTLPVTWSTPNPTVLDVREQVLTPQLAFVNAVGVGPGTVRASADGRSAESLTFVTALPDPVVPVTSGPDRLNGSYSFALGRGAGDCGLGLRDSIAGNLDVSGVPSSGRGGSAQLDYGTIYTFLDLLVVVAGADALDFESGPLRSFVTGYDVYISGRLAVKDRRGFLRFYWVQIGQPRSSSCAMFEGPMTAR